LNFARRTLAFMGHFSVWSRVHCRDQYEPRWNVPAGLLVWRGRL
jgi:hypothetical protein